MARLKQHAICIRHLDWSESSQLVVLLTETHGKLRGLAKGSKRLSPSSIQRFSGGIELLTRGEVVAMTRPSSELATITEWDMLDDCLHLRKNLKCQRAAMYAADVVHAMLADHDPHPATFAAMQTLMNQLRDAPPAPLLAAFQWAVLCDAGYRPQLDSDVYGGDPLPDAPAYTFDAEAGGLTMRNGIGSWRVRKSTVALLRTQSWADAEESALDRANRLMCSYVRALLGRELPTMRYVLGSTY